MAPLQFWDFDGADDSVESTGFFGLSPVLDSSRSASGYGSSLPLNLWEEERDEVVKGERNEQYAYAPVSLGGTFEGYTLSAWVTLPSDWFDRLCELHGLDAPVGSAGDSSAASGAALDAASGNGASGGSSGSMAGAIDTPIASLYLGSLEADDGPSEELVLAIRVSTPARTPQLVFSHSYPGQSAPSEAVIEISADSELWREGGWRQVAGVYDSNGLRVCDGVELEPCKRIGVEGAVSPPVQSGTVFMGTDSRRQHFLDGRLDNVAVHARALSEADLRAFALASTATPPSVGGCRWSTWSKADTTVTWAPECQTRDHESRSGVSVQLRGFDKSTGGLLAHIDPVGIAEGLGKQSWDSITRYQTAKLTAMLTIKQGYDFILSSGLTADGGHGRCTWHRGPGEGPREDEIPLATPSWCSCDGCGCSFMVRSAAITKRWDAQDDGAISVCKLAFELDENTGGTSAQESGSGSVVEVGSTGSEAFQGSETSAEVALGGDWGLGAEFLEQDGAPISGEGWCWRPLSYNYNAEATLTKVSDAEVSGSLEGSDNTVARLVADFAASGELLDVSDCATMSMEATMTSGAASAAPPSLEIVLADQRSCTAEWPLAWPDTNEPTVYEVDLRNGIYNGDIVGRRTTYEGMCQSFQPREIRYLGLQKNFGSSLPEGVVINILDITLRDEVGAPCARLVPTHPKDEYDGPGDVR